MKFEISSSSDPPENNFWDDLPKQIKQAINTAKDQLDRGEGIPHCEVMAEIKSRYRLIR